MCMRRTFHDISLQSKFEDDGYVIVSFLTSEEAEKLSSFYTNNTSAKNSEGLHSSILSDDIEFKKQTFEKIYSAFELQASKYVIDHDAVLAQFLVKEAFTPEKFDLHLDPALTDETKYAAISIWCALDDITSDNGAMFIQRTGHKHVNFVRASGPPIYFPEQFQGNEEIEIIELKAGQALIANQKVPHGSMPNNSNKPRVAANLRLIPKEADNMFYFKEANGDLSAYKVRADYYKEEYTKEPGGRPKHESLIEHIKRKSITGGIKKMHESLEKR